MSVTLHKADWVWVKMHEVDLTVGLRPSEVCFIVCEEQKSMILGGDTKSYADIYMRGQEDEKAVRISGTASDVAELLGLPLPGELEADKIETGSN